MSSLVAMKIQGIRSFGSQHEQAGVVKFHTPLTLILGPNGTGKTTIIESLRYATTGQFPPGTKANGFIHDPKIAHESEVKAQVGLAFRSVQRQEFKVIRSMAATQKASRVEAKTLDGVIIYKTPSGEEKHISSKCAQMDREVVSQLGVSKAVLDNVIFCHQEDSNWPLGESKQLKTKFEDIFACSRYAKVLDNIKNITKSNNHSITVCKEGLKHMKDIKNSAAEVKSEMMDAKAKAMTASDSLKKEKDELNPIMEKLTTYRTQMDKINRLNTEKEKMEGVKREKERNLEELRKSIENEFKGPTEELRKILKQFQSQVTEREKTLSKATQDLEAVEDESSSLGRKKNLLLREQGSLEQEAENNRQTIKSRDDFIHETSSMYDPEGFRGSMEDSDVMRFLSMLDSKAEAKKHESSRNRVNFEAEEQELVGKITQFQKEKTQLDFQCEMNSNQVRENTAKIRKLQRDLNAMDESAHRLTSIQQDLERATQELENLQQAVDTEVLKKEISELNTAKDKLAAQVGQLGSELSLISQESADRAKLSMYQKDKSSKEEQVRRLKSKHSDTLDLLFGVVPEVNLRPKLDSYIRDHTARKKDIEDALRSNQAKLTELETQGMMHQEDLDAKERSLREKQKQISQICGNQDLDESIEQVKSKLKQKRDEQGYVSSITHIYKKYIEKLAKDPCCPLCHRSFDGQAEVAELTNELTEKLNLVPMENERRNAAIAKFDAEHNSMVELKPVKALISQLEETDIPFLKKTIKDKTSQVAKLREEVDKAKDELSGLDQFLSMAQSIHSDICNIDKYALEAKDLDRQIQIYAAKVTDADSSRTIQQVQNELEEAQREQDATSRQWSSKKDKLSKHMESVQGLQSSVHQMNSEKLNIEKSLQERVSMEKEVNDLKTKNIALEKDSEDAKEGLRPLEEKISDLQEQKESLTRQQRRQQEAFNAEINRIKDHQKEVQRFQILIDRYKQKGVDNKLQSSKEQARSIDQRIAILTDKREHLAAEINKIKEDLSMQKVRERELNDNLKLHQKTEEVEEISAKVAELEKQLAGLGGANILQQMSQLEEQAGEKQSRISVLESRYNSYHQTDMDCQKQLKSDLYKNADRDYKHKMIELKTLEHTTKDLDKYHKSLEFHINRYHSTKMKEINRRIAELWRDTYRGNDIDTIEICTEDEESGTMKKRRTYNYRVVMMKGDVALDMRGRCSAGQKVLACLIIRLALAETFCRNFEFLALDEPTTNLDAANIRSLADSLIKIIQERQSSNFQLLVITHDEEFVEMMGQAEFLDEFYRVSKTPDGHSRINLARIRDIDL